MWLNLFFVAFSQHARNTKGLMPGLNTLSATKTSCVISKAAQSASAFLVQSVPFELCLVWIELGEWLMSLMRSCGGQP